VSRAVSDATAAVALRKNFLKRGFEIRQPRRTTTEGSRARTFVPKGSPLASPFPPGNYLTPGPLAIKDPRRVHFHRILDISTIIFPFGNMAHLIMDSDETAVDRRASEAASGFGSLIRSRRKALKMRQDQLALATGVGRRFLIELEAGKSSCQLGRSLLVAEALGLRPADVLASGGGGPDPSATGPELPDLGEEAEEPDGQSTRILRAAARRHD
jgi:transcriptional regulator with XRE-family HTH domain